MQARGSNESDEPYESYAYESDAFASAYESYEPYVNLMHVNLMSLMDPDECAGQGEDDLAPNQLVVLSLLEEHQYHCMCCNKIYINNRTWFCDNCQGSWSESQPPGKKWICQKSWQLG